MSDVVGGPVMAQTAQAPGAAATGSRSFLQRYMSSKISATAFTIVVVLFVLTLVGPVVAPYPNHITGAVETANRFQPPSLAHPFGTNELGQDVLSMVLGGARVSILTAVAIIASSALIGTIVGAAAGFFGRVVDESLMRVTEIGRAHV